MVKTRSLSIILIAISAAVLTTALDDDDIAFASDFADHFVSNYRNIYLDPIDLDSCHKLFKSLQGRGFSRIVLPQRNVSIRTDNKFKIFNLVLSKTNVVIDLIRKVHM